MILRGAELAYGSVFSASALSRSVRAGDSHQFGVDLKGNFKAIVDQASQAALSNSISFKQYETVVVRGKNCVFYGDYNTAIVVRALSRFLANKFSISPPQSQSNSCGGCRGPQGFNSVLRAPPRCNVLLRERTTRPFARLYPVRHGNTSNSPPVSRAVFRSSLRCQDTRSPKRHWLVSSTCRTRDAGV